MPHIGLISLVVDDYDSAIAHYVNDLGFTLMQDLQQVGKRWVVVAPPGTENNPTATHVLLAQASNDEQREHIGNQAGGRVFLLLYTDDFARDHARMVTAGIEFLEEARHEPYGIVAVFQDAFGNKWDLLQPAD